MRLTSLEIKGFKSFADKQVIHFDHDVIAIMGSNGCGKSNIVDAIRWVLGEQRAKTLRLEKMDNIIFNGTKDRKPGNMAQVSLTFDNTKNIIPTEFSNVTITRTIYRTGESDYQINGVSCRLKDIKNLFLDTGIGSSTYAIMELKMIDDILNDVDNSRRSLIEQAAGISKYKARKRETLQKLESTELDLNRVQDLLFEIENNLKSLESQAKKANRYKKVKEEYKALSIELAKYDILSINEQYENLTKVLEDLQDNRLQLETGIQKREAVVQQQKVQIIEREKTLSEEQKKLNDFINSIQTKESDKKVAQQKSEFLAQRIQVLSEQIISQKVESENLITEIQALNDSITKESTHLQTIKATADEAKQKLEKQRESSLQIKDALDKQRQTFGAVNSKMNEAEKQLAIRESKLESLKNANQRSLFEKEEKLEALKKLEVEVKKLEQTIQQHQALINGLVEKEAENVIQIELLEKSIEEKRNESGSKKRILDAKNNEFRLTKNMVESLEGFPDAIKFLKKKTDWLKKTPLLSDLLYTDEKYRVALEIVLQPYLNHFVVATSAEAHQSIQFLKEANKGRAHFFILEHFNLLKEKAPKLKLNKGEIAAVDIIELDAYYSALLTYLLKDVIIVTDSNEFKVPENSNAFYVDLAGQWIQTEKEISGGTVGLFEGKRLGRLKNLEKLEKEIVQLQEEVKMADIALKTDQEKLVSLKNNSFRTTIDRERRELQVVERDFVSFSSRIENSQEFVAQHSKRHEEVVGTISQLEKESKGFQKEFQDAKEAAHIYQLKLDALENDFKIASLEFTQLQEKFNEKNILFIQNENALQSYRQSLQFKNARQETIQREWSKNKAEESEAKIQIEQIKAQLLTFENELVLLYRERDQRKEDLSGQESGYYELKEWVQAEEDSIKNIHKQKEELDMAIHQKSEKRINLKFELQSLQQRLALEFKIDVEALLENLTAPTMERVEIEIQISKVNSRIENFGEVNPMAEAAYDEMKQRFDFITEQKDDLVASKATLLSTIQEIEHTAKEHFMDAFVAIRENFKNVFRSMFNEHDNCDLTLLDPNDPLESKVEIIAKPKGKRPQSINQLSGGEKSLTALSLLFALYLHKPAPFCILDEIDAPLDLANIDKFNKVIRDFSKSSQFIVVSHQEETGAAADVVHGVTMHKTGISILVSTDFRNVSKDARMEVQDIE
jgi:chromosome segregation protein